MKRVPLLSLVVAGIAALASPTSGIAADDAAPHPVIELRQYKIVPGKRDTMIALFEREFVESQEKLGMRLVGQFRDRDDPSRFTPQAVTYASRALSWDKLDPTLQSFAKMPG